MSNPKWPFGPATVETPTPAATNEVVIGNNKTLIIFNAALAAAMALTLTPHAELEAGAEVTIQALSDGTARTITITNALPATMAGTISKTKVQTFVYNGFSFIAKGAIVQLD